jgi:hypothetical protein
VTAAGAYPDCPRCGHNVSGVVAETCTSFVVYPEGDPRGMAGYCGHRCADEPEIRAWLGPSYRTLAEALRSRDDPPPS